MAWMTQELGAIDALINNAGTTTVGTAHTMRLADFRDAMNTNFWGALYAILLENAFKVSGDPEGSLPEAINSRIFARRVGWSSQT